MSGTLLAALLVLLAPAPEKTDEFQGAERFEGEAGGTRRPDWIAPLAQAKWVAQEGWLANPARRGEHAVERGTETTVFRVARSGFGMKWSWALSQPIKPEGYRFAAMRYQAAGVAPQSDYALCVLGKSTKAGGDYATVIPSAELISDGRWHTANVDMRQVAGEFLSVEGLALQVQAAAAAARLEVADIRLVQQLQPSRLADALDWKPQAAFEGFQAVPLGAEVHGRSSSWRRRLRLADWFTGPAVDVFGVPFVPLFKEPDLAATPLGEKLELRIACDAAAGEVYLLLLAAFSGQEEPVYGTGRLAAIRDVDRFRLRLEYADGTADEWLPMNVATKRFGIVEGPQVVVAAADSAKRLRAIVLNDMSKQAAFAVAAATVRTRGDRLFPEALEESPPLRVKGSWEKAKGGCGKAKRAPDNRAPGTSPGSPPAAPADSSRASGTGVSPVQQPHWLWGDRRDAGPTGFPAGSTGFATGFPVTVELVVDGKPTPADRREPVADPPPGAPQGFRWFQVPAVEGLRLGMAIEAAGEDGGSIRVALHNAGAKEHRVTLVAPRIGPYRLSEKAKDSYYLVPNRGAALDWRDGSFRERYCGTFPVQFLDTFCPSEGRGLSLRTEDTQCLQKLYRLEKKGAEFTVGVEYPDLLLKPGELFTSAPAIVTVTDGDWHSGLDAYRRWTETWYRPISPRKPWFREVFNFRQRFLWWLDPLYDAKSGKIDLQRAVDEARREFGGIDYLHLFDWGNCGPYGRIYGRTGDYSPYDYLQGGRDALRKAIAGVQAQDIRVGLYIEAYLLEERGKLGQGPGKLWQMIGQDGKRRYWPESTEMYVCSYVPAWREVQASTYAAKVRELDVDGMYLDEYGFAGTWVDCWSEDHGHPVPGYAVTGERDGTAMVRRRIEEAKKNVALYTEETPVDVTTQFQDGSFTYAMSSAASTETLVPLNLTRFALPSFKTIEILYCDKPTGSWATGVRWVFFGGEAIWLEGPAGEWFEPETRAAIRRCYAILRKHRDAFTTLAPVPLVPTEAGGVFANAFPIPGKTVYTLYNARNHTVRGELLRVPQPKGAAWYDEWHGRPATVRVDGADAVIRLEIGPRDVGCVVAESR